MDKKEKQERCLMVEVNIFAFAILRAINIKHFLVYFHQNTSKQVMCVALDQIMQFVRGF
jgi:hypothetical protein